MDGVLPLVTLGIRTSLKEELGVSSAETKPELWFLQSKFQFIPAGVAAADDGKGFSRLFVYDRNSKLKFLIDNGAAYSVFPVSSANLNVSRPILGADFVERIELLIDIKSRRLIDKLMSLKNHIPHVSGDSNPVADALSHIDEIHLPVKIDFNTMAKDKDPITVSSL
ncbi:hypothetical protein AVEN_216325-1 [Araneus ventricosus]|uniref:Peptidase A2 domain-containing protein n=1 Tax=Araneus ventricosus TaxID=182803 RepID=A0A4Y2MN26_ARAVE|nr:hypothetical protein AVEN_216325-1 [Araneus ventricosus]